MLIVWIICFAIGMLQVVCPLIYTTRMSVAACAVSLIGFGIKIQAFAGIVKLRRSQFNLDDADPCDAYTTKHTKRHHDVTKSIRMCIANVLAVGLFRDIC